MVYRGVGKELLTSSSSSSSGPTETQTTASLKNITEIHEKIHLEKGTDPYIVLCQLPCHWKSSTSSAMG